MSRHSSLPPLTSLMAAETVARTGSISAAARELRVSAPAVSQQIRILEDHLGRKLFDRGRRGVALTDAGRAVLPYLSEGFANLARVSDVASGPKSPGRVSISAPASIAMEWLPGIAGILLREDPTLSIELRMDEDPVDFREGGPDIRIGYGDLPYAGLEREPLERDFLLPVCAPDYSGKTLIHTDWGASYATLPTWKDWAKVAALPSPAPRDGQKAGAATLALSMARQGFGIALGNALYGVKYLNEGCLTSPFGPAIDLPQPYYVSFRPRRPRLVSLVDRIRSLAETQLAEARSFVIQPAT